MICSLFLFSCGKDSIENLPIDDTGNFYGYKVKDTTGIDKENLVYTSTSLDTTFIWGLKYRKIWIGCFNKDTKEQLNEWNGIEQLPDSIKKFSEIPPYSFTTITEKHICFANLETNDMNSYKILLILSSKDNSAKYIESSSYEYVHIYDDAIYLSSSKSPYNLILGDLYSLENNVITISSASKYTTGDSTFISGFYNDKVRFRLYSESTKKLIQEWNGQEEFNRNIKIYKGYGEYSNFYVDALNIQLSSIYERRPNIINTSWGIAFIPDYKQKDLEYILSGDLFLLNDNKAMCYHLGDDINRSYGVNIKKWYNESILMQTVYGNFDGYKYLVFSSEGTIIEELSGISYPDPLIDSYLVPISYTEGISLYLKNYVQRINYKTGKTIWRTLIEPIKNVGEYDGKWSKELIDNSTNDWIYQIEILFYNGSKQQVKFSVDIVTGEIKYI